MTFDSWESGREEMKTALLTEQCKVGDLLYMKYHVQQPILELEIDAGKFANDQDVQDFMKKKSKALAEAKEALNKKFELEPE